MSQIVKSTPFPRVLWQFCLCRSAGESIPASHQVLRQVQMQGAGQRPHPCSGVATASCLTSVSPFVITRTLFAKRVHLNNSSLKNNSFFISVVLRVQLDSGVCPFHLLYAVSRRDVLPRGRSVLCLQGMTGSQNPDHSSTQSSSNSPVSTGQQFLTADSSTSDHQGELEHSPEIGLFSIRFIYKCLKKRHFCTFLS